MNYQGNRLVLSVAVFFGCIIGAIAVLVTVGVFAIFSESSVNFLPFYSIVFDEGGLILTMQWAYWLVFLVAFVGVGCIGLFSKTLGSSRGGKSVFIRL